MCNQPLKTSEQRKLLVFSQINVFLNCTITANYQSALSLTGCRSVPTYISSSLGFLQECVSVRVCVCACMCVCITECLIILPWIQLLDKWNSYFLKRKKKRNLYTVFLFNYTCLVRKPLQLFCLIQEVHEYSTPEIKRSLFICL